MTATTRTVVTITITGAEGSDPAVAVEHDESRSPLAARDALLRRLVQLPPQHTEDERLRRTG